MLAGGHPPPGGQRRSIRWRCVDRLRTTGTGQRDCQSQFRIFPYPTRHRCHRARNGVPPTGKPCGDLPPPQSSASVRPFLFACGAAEGAFHRPSTRELLTPHSGNIGQKLGTKLVPNSCLAQVFDFIGAPKGNRTPVFAVKGRRPGPLDDGRASARGRRNEACYKGGRAGWQAAPRLSTARRGSPARTRG